MKRPFFSFWASAIVLQSWCWMKPGAFLSANVDPNHKGLQFWLFKRTVQSSGTVTRSWSSYGTDFDSSELAGPEFVSFTVPASQCTGLQAVQLLRPAFGQATRAFDGGVGEALQEAAAVADINPA